MKNIHKNLTFNRYEDGGGLFDRNRRAGEFDDDGEEEDNDSPQERIRKEKADEIEQTINVARDLLDVDYLLVLKENESTKKYYDFLREFKHMNLYKHGWRMQYMTHKATVGLCNYEDQHKAGIVNLSKNRNIYLSIDYVKHDTAWMNNMKDVVLHEMAHAMVSEVFYFFDQSRMSQLLAIDPNHKTDEGHGKVWIDFCHALSGKVCDRYYENAKLAASFKNYRYKCFNCSHIEYGDNMKFATQCKRCGKGVLCEKNV